MSEAMGRFFTRTEIERRNHKDNAAIIIDNIVYDVTQFLEDHPGGVEILLDNAGRDASKCFRDVGHSEDAKLWRKQFKIGEIVDSEKWEILSPPIYDNEARNEWTMSGVLEVLTPPVILAGLAIFIYTYLL